MTSSPIGNLKTPDSYNLETPVDEKKPAARTFSFAEKDILPESNDSSFEAADDGYDNDNEEELASMMTKVDLNKKVPRKLVLENEIVYFQDSRHNKLVALKIRLPSATMDSDVDLSLKMKSTSQYLHILMAHNPFFLHPKLTQNTVGKIIGTKGREWENFKHGQEVLHKKLRDENGKYSKDHEGDERTEPIMSACEIKLDFICDDLFDDSVKAYPKTGYYFQRILVPGKKKSRGGDRDAEWMTVLSVVLVSKEKVKPQKLKGTPVKESDITDLFDENDNGEDDDDNLSFVSSGDGYS